MNIEFSFPGESQRFIEMTSPPRFGDLVAFDGKTYRVRDVWWAPNSEIGGSAIVFLESRPRLDDRRF